MFRDTTTRDKLIFPSAIMWILCHFSVPFLSSNYFSVMCAIDATTVKLSEAQFRSWQSDSATPPSRLAPSTSAPSSFSSDVSLRDIMAQLQRMDARIDTLSTKLYQVNVCVGCIALWQVIMGGFAPKASPPPPPMASDSDDDGDDDDASDDDDDGDASSTDEMST